ncbi:MAG TPA: phosphatase PAP2 family protein [Pyrinomonadaceae bacterium]|jgi:undecaprenyl-diphosphatase
MTNFSARDFLSVQLLAGVVIFATMTVALGEISENIINREPLTLADVQLSNWLHAHSSPLLTKAMFVATSLGSTVAVTCIAVALGLYFLWRRRFYWLAALATSVGGGALLNKLLKYIFHRPRPHFDDPILKLTSYSFPSGHTMMATVLYGVVAAYLLAKTQDWRWRVLIILSTGLLIALVAFSRMYLGAHYLSDVLGAMAEGLAWMSLCLTIVYSVWERRHGK